MAKPKTLRERAVAWIKPNDKPTLYLVIKAYIAGHRAGSRLTKAERKKLAAWWPVVSKAIRWYEDDTGDGVSEAELRAAVKQLFRVAAKSSKKVRK
jgi:hypothetical protein